MLCGGGTVVPARDSLCLLRSVSGLARDRHFACGGGPVCACNALITHMAGRSGRIAKRYLAFSQTRSGPLHDRGDRCVRDHAPFRRRRLCLQSQRQNFPASFSGWDCCRCTALDRVLVVGWCTACDVQTIGAVSLRHLSEDQLIAVPEIRSSDLAAEHRRGDFILSSAGCSVRHRDVPAHVAVPPTIPATRDGPFVFARLVSAVLPASSGAL